MADWVTLRNMSGQRRLFSFLPPNGKVLDPEDTFICEAKALDHFPILLHEAISLGHLAVSVGYGAMPGTQVGTIDKMEAATTVANVLTEIGVTYADVKAAILADAGLPADVFLPPAPPDPAKTRQDFFNAFKRKTRRIQPE